MAASDIWTVHCSRCLRWDDQFDSRSEAEDYAKSKGWLVGKKGEPNLCPDCRKLGPLLPESVV